MINWTIEKTVKKGDYLYAVVKDHPNATQYGYVLYHRIIMENHIGRLLQPDEIVHHINHNKKDNNIENLELMTNSDHAKHHQRDKGRLWCELKCPQCKKVFHRERRQTFINKSHDYSCCSKQCRGKFSRMNKTPEAIKAISENLIREYRKYTN